ncbi:hypothetical protein GCK72_007998 [Caenorhabditis remanei]|uniref:F-box associated domain-containing protein n=1 Tax=Caenorhabditis remanei TaxID=31234 RepID=A0A6A5HNZ8_CAERE|nr:hypothetical protein GCK72_007998 [Caenorhabditis remanei]KAF1768037.1 hypothetical protein GCK72_007998 [Caenorhabditis remanei]
MHLTSRSSFLQRIDKAIPVRANHFYIEEDYLSLDGFQFTVKPGPWYSNEEKEKGTLLMSYLKRRQSVNADEVYFYEVETSPNIPVKLDLTINKLGYIFTNLEVVLPMINPRSLPLAELSMFDYDDTDIDLEIFRSARDVIFGSSQQSVGLEKIPNKKVYISRPKTDFVRKIIRYWMQNEKEIGTEFSMSCEDRSDLVEKIAILQEELHETQGYLEEINQHFVSGFSIPLSSTSKLLVYGIEKNENEWYTFELVLKVV